MRVASVRLPALIGVTGAAYLAAILFLVLTKAPLGSTIFFIAAAIMFASYAAVLARVWHEPSARGKLLFACFAFAVAFRVPPAVAPVGSDSDMVRYLWDGRVQHLGYSPYALLPADPSLAHTHTDQSAVMPSRRDRTPYPPAAQLFFRLVVGIHDSTTAMKLALVACDLLTMVVLWRWLVAARRSEWLTLTYAWNPLVVLEVSHSGHIDALAALWTVAAAFWLTRRRTLVATIAFVLAIATKFLPVVLAPLFIRRIRVRDAIVGLICLAALYLPFLSHGGAAVGALPNVVDRVRFNGPIFAAVAALFSPRIAAAIAVLLGIGAACWARWKLSEADPDAWAWPMAIALACAPVIYPWYLLPLTPFLFSRTTLPLTTWTAAALAAYEVWDQSRHGGRWIVPGWILAIEFGVVAVVAILLRWPQHLNGGAPDSAELGD